MTVRLGHVLLELLLDACLIERDPESLPRYYEALAQVDAGEVGRLVAGWSEPTAERLGRFVELFRQERFLFDYLDNQKLVHRLSQVARRARLERVPDGLAGVLPESRESVRRATDALMDRTS